ncbi:hypothetical protein ZIOFF_011674 [Zingiber officinale]|uniref:WRC domain-containing protein n=1 Tax=Zingiber officinale TaxID=94328 RepID=A0A8J5LQ86_ZINOF|nr:hypothetical protein ZIOFF_011674 [Zingiber officinale]
MERALLHLRWLDIDYAIRKDESLAINDFSIPNEIDLYEKWERSNRLCVIFIKTKISTDIRGSIEEHGNVKDLFKTIDEQFATSNKALASTLIMEFSSLRLTSVKGARRRRPLPSPPPRSHLLLLGGAARIPSLLSRLPPLSHRGSPAMRIRKCAARLLGTVCAASFSSPTPPPQHPRAADDAFSSDGCGILCELNRAPWDDLMCLDLVAAFDQDEEEEDGEGIMGNAVKAEAGEDTGILGNHLKNDADSTATVERYASPDLTLDFSPSSSSSKRKSFVFFFPFLGSEEARKEPKKKKKKKKENEEKTGARCKKSDGRGWHCKRLAQHPHSLCSYHLAQLRSYNASKVEVSKENRAGRKKQADLLSGGTADDSNFYYYYSGFGPWRGKTRSSGSRSDHICVRGFALEDEDDKEEDREDNGIVYEVAAVTIAGGDEEDSDVDNNGGSGGNREDNTSRNASNRGNHKSYKKRGRKRMKARSLKSLL